MEAITTRDVPALPLAERQAIEHLLGESLSADQKVFIMAFTPGRVADGPARQAARARLLQTLDKAQEHALQTGVTAEETEAAVIEALNHIRQRPTG